MPREGSRPEEIIAKLREADVLLGRGKKVAEVVKALGVSEVTDDRWRQEYGKRPRNPTAGFRGSFMLGPGSLHRTSRRRAQWAS